jgi:hypothetical protein
MFSAVTPINLYYVHKELKRFFFSRRGTLLTSKTDSLFRKLSSHPQLHTKPLKASEVKKNIILWGLSF